jgi:hypothetical protein
MILCMPTIGQKVRVLDGQIWNVKIYWESRNEGAIEHFTGTPYRTQIESYWDEYEGGRAAMEAHWADKNNVPRPELRHTMASIPEGSVLTIDRIYLRKGKGDFDSVTFVLNKPPGSKKKGPMVRFWTRLDDVNSGRLELLF